MGDLITTLILGIVSLLMGIHWRRSMKRQNKTDFGAIYWGWSTIIAEAVAILFSIIGMIGESMPYLRN